jgi:hypothetical protein
MGSGQYRTKNSEVTLGLLLSSMTHLLMDVGRSPSRGRLYLSLKQSWSWWVDLRFFSLCQRREIWGDCK